MVELREANARDAAATIALWQTCELTRPWNDPAGDFQRAVDWSGSAVLLAEDAGDLVASAMVGFDGHRGWIYYLAVAPAQRGRGLGREIVTAAEAWLHARGCPKAELTVRTGNPAAALYPRLG